MRTREIQSNIPVLESIKNLEGVWFVYDGACPVCTKAALALRIKERFGQLHLLDARTDSEHKLVCAVNAEGLDLDEGMVIYHDRIFYSGESALWFMSRYGAAKGWFNLFNKSLFWSDGLARLIYPWMRALRNRLIRNKNIGKIDNLQLKDQPILKSVFAQEWEQLPPVLQRHYELRPYTNDSVAFEGVLDVTCRWPIKILAPMFWLAGSIPIKNARDVPVTVHFESDADNKIFHFKRQFFFKPNKPHRFESKLWSVQSNEVVEMMRFGVCWRSLYCWEDGRIKMKHKGYAWKLLGHLVPMPLTWLLGKGYGEEWAVGEERYAMCVSMTHRLWGRIYQYKGQFQIAVRD